MTTPTPGRSVIFVLTDGITTRPAVVIEALDGRCCLHVFLKPIERECGTSDYQALVPYDLAGGAGTWHWPTFSTHASSVSETGGGLRGVNSAATIGPVADAGHPVSRPLSTGEMLLGIEPHRQLGAVLNESTEAYG